MEITTLGIIQAMKNLGLWITTTYTLIDIKANIEAFLFALLLYALISIPTDIYLLNKAHESAEKPTEPEA